MTPACEDLRNEGKLKKKKIKNVGRIQRKFQACHMLCFGSASTEHCATQDSKDWIQPRRSLSLEVFSLLQGGLRDIHRVSELT